MPRLGGGQEITISATGTLAAWTAVTAVGESVMRTAPDGSVIVSTSARTTRASYDATEAAFWATLSIDTTDLEASIVAAATVTYVDDAIDGVLVLLDDTAPSTPANLASTLLGSGLAADLTWDASTDNVGVTGYRLYREISGAGYALIDSPSSTTYSDAGLTPSTTYNWKVSAVDAAGNESAQSTLTSKTTGSGIPALPTTGLVHRWRASDLATADDATVASWVDSVGGVSLTASGTPKMRFAEINGLKVVEYGGAAGTAKHDSPTTLGPYTGTTKVVVGKLTATPGVGVTWAMIDQVGTSTAHRQRILVTSVSDTIADAGTQVPISGVPGTTAHAWAGVYSGNTGSAGPSGPRRDATRVNGSVGTGDTISVRLGQSASGTQSSIMVAEVLVYSTAMNTADLDAVYSYIGYTYGITVS